MTERDVLDLIHKRYSKINMGTSPRYLIAEQPNYRQRSRADCLVLDRNFTYDYTRPRGSGKYSYQAVHGFEVKCSRADWVRERDDPRKSQTWSRFCHHWWLVVSDKDIVRPGELPEGWGLLVPRGNTLAAVTKAPFQEAKPLNHEAVLAVTLAVARTALRTGNIR